CVYNERCAEGVQHEMSRFLRQMLAETDIPIRTLWLRSEPEAKTSPTLEIKKTKEVMDFLLRRYDQNMPDGEHIMLSPSAINTYISCPMQFYLDKVLRIRQEDNPEEGLANNTIGTIFHDSAELFYDWLQKEFSTDTITADMLCKKIEQDFVVRDVIKRQLQLILHVAFDVSWFNPFDGYDHMPELLRRLPKAKKIAATNEYRGTVLIVHGVLERYLLELIRYDARHAPFRIIGSEVERHLEIEIPSPSGSEENIKIKVGGRVDRIDEMGGRRRIVDYKTGTFKPEESVTMKKVMSSYESIAGYYRQLFTYSLAEAQKKETTMPIQPILFYPSQAADRKYEPSLNIAKKDIDDFATQHGEEFREGLQSIIADIFDPEKPFVCNGNEKSCKYCKLSMICGKKNY
ncbi:MAG: PD-(D/E)XK nuclease family protein, partial [Bacteroidaceae bacterium]|nr:PD-(D/E)XK nuclease family protein [Bacteroidaceae bacterium]